MTEEEELKAKICSLEENIGRQVEVVHRKEEELRQSGVKPEEILQEDKQLLIADKELLLVYEKRLLVYEGQLASLKAASAARGAASNGAGGSLVLRRLEELKLALSEQKAERLEERKLQQEMQQLLSVIVRCQFQPTSSGSTKGSKTYRQNAFDYYGYALGDKVKVPCMVTHELMPCSAITAGHIYRQSWSKLLLRKMGIHSVHDPRNIILVRSEVEAAFDKFYLTIIPQSGEDGSNFLEIHVLKPALLTAGQQQHIGTGNKNELDTVKWADVHKSHLHEVEGGNLPARRLLALHALLAIDHAVIEGWLKPDELKVSESGWASPTFDMALMRRFLIDADGGRGRAAVVGAAAAAAGEWLQQQQEQQEEREEEQQQEDNDAEELEDVG